MKQKIENYDLWLKISRHQDMCATEKQIRLLRQRMNKNQQDAKKILGYISEIMPWSIKVTNLQMVKMVLSLYGKSIKKNGVFRKKSPLGNRELHILNNAKEAYLSCFYTKGDNKYTPVWRIETENEEYFDYMEQDGKTKIVG